MARRPPEDAKQKHLGGSGIGGRDCDWAGWPGGCRFKGRQTARYARPSSARATTRSGRSWVDEMKSRNTQTPAQQLPLWPEFCLLAQPSLFLTCRGKQRSLGCFGILRPLANIPKGASAVQSTPFSRKGENRSSRVPQPRSSAPAPLMPRCAAAKSHGQSVHWPPLRN